MHGIARLQGARAGGDRVEHLLPARAVVVAARHGTLQRVDRTVLGRRPELLGRALDALGQESSEPAAVDDQVDELAGALDVAPSEVEPELRPGVAALLHALHDPTAEPAELVAVQTR